jgi:tRNA threonylcarbamoyladenosine biosynthesis protein TsaE
VLLSTTSPTQLQTVASQIISFAADTRIFLFYGEMGAGKTTLIKALCECLGTTDNVTSPTFSIVNEYIGGSHKIFHFDFYRLKDQSEALDMGYEEYFYSDAYCFIEWPERIPDLLPANYISINIKVTGDTMREINIEKN